MNSELIAKLERGIEELFMADFNDEAEIYSAVNEAIAALQPSADAALPPKADSAELRAYVKQHSFDATDPETDCPRLVIDAEDFLESFAKGSAPVADEGEFERLLTDLTEACMPGDASKIGEATEALRTYFQQSRSAPQGMVSVPRKTAEEAIKFVSITGVQITKMSGVPEQAIRQSLGACDEVISSLQSALQQSGGGSNG